MESIANKLPFIFFGIILLLIGIVKIFLYYRCPHCKKLFSLKRVDKVDYSKLKLQTNQIRMVYRCKYCNYDKLVVMDKAKRKRRRYGRYL